ncbi:MAG: methionine--tRNA ligase [Candidatus Woesearchaeota archaeon]
MAKQKILITSALPYVNNVPHLGNLICIISADVYARFERLRENEVLSVLGTDEHGTTTETKAIEEGVTPQEICDTYFAIHKDVYDWFNTDFDCLGRTSSPINKEITIDIFTKLQKNGYIFKKEITQFFDEKKQTFLADRFIKGICPYCGFEDARGDQCDSCGKLLDPDQLKNPVSLLSGEKPVEKQTEHLYIDLPKLKPQLEAFINKNKKSWSENAVSITDHWLKDLQPRAITRDLKWGIPVPGFEKKVFYSWFDAPIGYIGITAQHKNDWKSWWQNDAVKLVQFMGKDNTQFHTVLFPAFLLGTKDPYTLVNSLSVNEYLNYADGKFSKSRKTGVFGDSAKETGIVADAYRYYLTAIRPEQEDTVFDWVDFAQKVNKELIDNFCNLVNRAVSFTKRNFEGRLTTTEAFDIDYKKIEMLYQTHNQKQALKEIIHYSKQLNHYFQENEPWKRIKTDANKAHVVLSTVLNRIYDLTVMISPIVPKLAQEIFAQLQITQVSWTNLGTDMLKPSHTVGVASPLLEKVSDERVLELKEQFSGKKTFALDLRVAKVESVKKHPNADKLYVITVVVGDHQRQIVSGLVDYYSIDELVGKSIVLVANLEPATIRGVKSQGMLLAGEYKDVVKVLECEQKSGTQVLPLGYISSSKILPFSEFKKIKIALEDNRAKFNGKLLLAKEKEVTCELAQGRVS